MEPLVLRMSGSEEHSAKQEHCSSCSCKSAKVDKPQEVPKQAIGTWQKTSKMTVDPKVQYARSTSHFLNLPPELRCLVYEELLVVGKVFYKNTGLFERDNTIRFKDKEYFREPYLAILRTSKLVHDEAEKVYLSKNLFVMPSRWQYYAPFMYRQNTLNSRSLFSERGLDYVRNLSIALDRADILDMYRVSQTARSWSVTSNYDFMMPAERLEAMHELAIDDISYQDSPTDYAMTKLARRSRTVSVEAVEMDWRNAYCPLGCCRPLNIFNNR
jgi:hypothetical protein